MNTDLMQINFGMSGSARFGRELRTFLIRRISEMLDHESDLLWSTLYRLDIDEKKIRIAIEQNPGIPIAEKLADLVLDRQKEKRISREKYSAEIKEFNWGEDE